MNWYFIIACKLILASIKPLFVGFVRLTYKEDSDISYRAWWMTEIMEVNPVPAANMTRWLIFARHDTLKLP